MPNELEIIVFQLANLKIDFTSNSFEAMMGDRELGCACQNFYQLKILHYKISYAILIICMWQSA